MKRLVLAAALLFGVPAGLKQSRRNLLRARTLLRLRPRKLLQKQLLKRYMDLTSIPGAVLM